MKKNFVLLLAFAGMAISCGSNAKQTMADLEANQWKMDKMTGYQNDTSIYDQNSFILAFSSADSTVSGVAACNRYFGKFEVERANELDIDIAGATMMACPNMDMEQPYFHMLDEVDEFEIKNGRLILMDDKKIVAEFVKYNMASVADMHNAENALDYTGDYVGEFPAADCPGIKMDLELKSDNKYSLEMEYIDRDTKVSQEGTYSVNGNMLTLNSANNDVQYYLIGENKLSKLDEKMEPITGDLAPMYVLTKKQ